MPVQYSSVLEEHRCVRENVGIFDLSHMGELLLTGKDAGQTLSLLTTNDPFTLEFGDIQYTILTNENGGIIDDILVYRIPEGYFLVVNASNTEKDRAWIASNLIGDTTLIDLSAETVLLALQGPQALDLLNSTLKQDFSGMKGYTFVDQLYLDEPLRISRTGYTGEDGFELYLPNKNGIALWQSFMDQGQNFGLLPIGLGARDTLRLEMRMPLYGNDIDDTTTPLEAGLNRFIKFDKGEFAGRAQLLAQREQGIPRKLVGFVLEERGIPRHGYKIFHESKEVGMVTSGSMSPTREQGIGMGYVDSTVAKPGTMIEIEIRQKRHKAEIIKGRFVQVAKES